MCMLLKFDSAKFGFFNLLFSEVIEEKPLWGGLDPTRPNFAKEGLICFIFSFSDASCYTCR